MLPALVLLAPVLPIGTTTMPELCRWLTAATGTTHGVQGELRDYPIFLSIKSNEPARIKMLVATALGGQWEQDGKTIRLAPIRPKPDAGLAEFERKFRLAVPKTNLFSELPVAEVYRLRPGQLLRFGTPANSYVRPFPASLAAKYPDGGRLYIRRFCDGIFETKIDLPNNSRGVFDHDSEISFSGLPDKVAALLGDDAKQIALTHEESAAAKKLLSDPLSRKIDWKAVDHIDPLAGMFDPTLIPISKKIHADLVIPILDLGVLALTGSDGGNQIGGWLGRFTKVIDLDVQDGAIVGRLPISERLNRSQTKRSVLGDFVVNVRSTGIASPDLLSRYLAAQSIAASESWIDMMLVVMSGVVIDQTHLGDFPFNLQLSSRLNGNDWAVLRSGQDFDVKLLSVAARDALLALMVGSRERMGTDQPDPVLWPGFPSKPLRISAKIEDEEVLVGFVGYAASVSAATQAAGNHSMRTRELGREPLYQLAQRRKLTLTILPTTVESNPVKTGFAEVTFAPGSKPVPWKQLPPAMAKEFEERLKAAPDQP